MSTVQNVDIKALMAKAKAHNQEQLNAAKAQIAEEQSKKLIADLARNLTAVADSVAAVVENLRKQRKIAKLWETRLQTVANAQAKFETDGDIKAFEKSSRDAQEAFSKKYYSL